MNFRRKSSQGRGFTLIELLVVVAVTSVLLAIAAPSMKQLIATERLKNINAQLVTDIQAARAAAVAQGQNGNYVYLQFKNTASMSCYVAFTAPCCFNTCNCSNPLGGSVPICSHATVLHTTQIPTSTDVQVVWNQPASTYLIFQENGLLNLTSATQSITTSRISGAPGTLVTTLYPMGHPSVCSPDSSVAGAQTC